MSGQSSQTQQQSSQTAPWAPAQPALQNILAGINAGIPSYQANPTQQTALSQLTSNAQALPNFQQPGANIASADVSGDPFNILNPAYQQYQNTVNPIANGSLNPMNTPGFNNALNTMNTDITNQINGQFAGAGRSLSGDNTQALARGISQGDSQAIAGQYNANVANVTGAAGGLLNAGAGTSSALSGNQNTGLNIAGGILPTLAQSGPASVLAAQQAQTNLPLNNLGAYENLTVPIAGLGGQSNGQASGTSNMSQIAQILGLSQSANQLFGGQKPAAGGLLNFLGV